MKRAGLVTFLLLAGCSNIDATQARRYKCDPAATDVQCPGGWLCTLEGFCADPDAGIDLGCLESADCTGGWRCAKTQRCVDPAVGLDLPCDGVADCTGSWKCAKTQRCVDPTVGVDLPCDGVDDCTGGWKCAKTQRCVDPNVGRPLPCAEVSDCTGGWICGAIMQCLDPDAGVAWPCNTNEDCTAGWHCGVGRVCYDLATAAGVACRADAGDCAPGWRCGLEANCHDTSIGAPVRCAQDTDCDQGWRCDVGGHCIDAAQDALRPTADAGAGQVTPFRSFVPEVVEHVSTSGGLQFEGKSARYNVFLGPSGLTVAISGDPGFGLFSAGDGGLLSGLVAQVPAPAGARAVTITGGRSPLVWVAVPGGLMAYEFRRPDQLVVVSLVALPFTPSQLRLLDRTHLAAFDGSRLALRFDDGGVSQPAFDAGISDVALVPADIRLADGGELGGSVSVVVLTAGGSSAAPWPAATSWQRVALHKGDAVLFERLIFPPVDECPCIPPRTCTGNRCVGPGEQGPSAVAVSVDGAGTNRMVDRLSFQADTQRFGRLVRGGLALLASTSQTLNCTGAPLALTATARLDDAGSRFAATVFCRGDGGVVIDTSSNVDPQVNGFTVSEDGAGVVMAAGRGQAWRMGDDLSPAVPLVPTTGVAKFLGSASAPFIRTEARTSDAVSPSLRAVSCGLGRTAWLWCREEALLTGEVVTTRVAGRPDWALADLSELGGNTPPFGVFSLDLSQGDPVDFVASSAIDFGPVSAAAAIGPDGGAQVMVAASDRLYFGLAGAPGFLAVTPSFRFATVPQPGGSVTSLAPVPTDPGNVGARFAEGYLISSGRVYRYAADNEVVWRTQELVIGAAEGLHVWSDGRRGRVIFRDGSVYGLPSRVQLAAAITPGASAVFGVEASCGQTFALAADGLYRLSAGATTLATWERLDLLGVPNSVLPGGRLIAEENSLLLMLPDGYSRRVSGFGCLAPN